MNGQAHIDPPTVVVFKPSRWLEIAGRSVDCPAADSRVAAAEAGGWPVRQGEPLAFARALDGYDARDAPAARRPAQTMA